MDPSTNSAINGGQHANGQSYGLLNGIQNFAGEDTLSNGEDLSRFFDPALFDTTTIGNGFSQPSLAIPQETEQNNGRQSTTPDNHQYNAPQQSYGQNQFSQAYYNPQLSQSGYDPRFFSRPSVSPVGFDNSYPYGSQLSYNAQHFNPQQMNMPQRQTSTPTQNFPPRQQQNSPFINIASRPSQMSHVQNNDLMRFSAFQPQSQSQPSSRFVDPSMLTGHNMMHTDNNNFQQQQQSYLSPSYYKATPSVDPRSLQAMQTLQPPSKPGQPMVVIPKSEQSARSMTAKDPNAPKRPRGRPRKDGTIRLPGTSATSTSSDDELEIEDEEPPEMTPALLTLSMPVDERGRALYNAVLAVWSPRNRAVDPEKVRSGISSFADTIRGLRDAWKAKNEVLRKAELPDAPAAADVPRLKEEVAKYRQVLETVMQRSLLYGHSAIVKRLGENQFTLSPLHSFMLDRFNASDYDSTLVSAILKFVVKFETLDSEMLAMTKLTKILERLTKKATGEVKSLAQTVLDNAVAASKKKTSAARKPASPQAVGSPADGSRKDPVAGVKRPREGDALTQPVVKKIVKVTPASSKPLAVRMEERRKAEEAAKRAAKIVDKAAVAPARTAATAATMAARTKVAVAAPQKSSLFGALSSVSKKPGTSNAERAAAAAKDKVAPAAGPAPSRAVKREPGKKESPPRSVGPIPVLTGTQSSFFTGLLANIGKDPPKEEKKEEKILDETEEQRTKRLRKEARRKLRVSWKPDDSLVDVRLFTHDPDEELEQGDRLKANAGGGREGEALKSSKNLDDLEDEEDEESFEDLEEYSPPSDIDFTHLNDPLLGEDSPHKLNTARFGGSATFESTSKEAQDGYEQDTLMAIYASKADRPATPKEPTDDDNFEPAEPETPFGEPSDEVRKREREYLARQAPRQPQPTIDLAALAQAMSTAPRLQPQQTGPVPTELQRALSMFSGPAQSNLQPQVAAQPPSAVNLQAILSALGQGQAQQQQAQVQPQYAAPNLSALISSLQPSAGVPSTSSANALPLGINNNTNLFSTSTYEDPSRKHARSESTDPADIDFPRKANKKKKAAAAAAGAEGTGYTTGFDAQGKPYNYKTQVCTFWEQGKCVKGDSCTYLHGEE